MSEAVEALRAQALAGELQQGDFVLQLEIWPFGVVRVDAEEAEDHPTDAE